MKNEFDLIVLGTGSAGSAAADVCRRAGWKVAIVDHRPFGGTCALRGCDPKKVLVGAADLLDWLRRMHGKGLSADTSHIVWPELMKFKRTFTDPVPESREKQFEQSGITKFHARARFVDDSVIEVDGKIMKARFILIATGAIPVPLNIAGEDYVITSEQFLELEELPRSIIFIGGGYISFEFAHIAARAGAKVTILHKDDHPLARFDPELVSLLVAGSQELGIDVQFNARVNSIESRSGSFFVAAGKNSSDKIFRGDLVVHGAGRVPDVELLELQKAHVRSENHRIAVNEFLQSVSNPAIYAAGDAAESGPPLTPVAGRDGKVAAENMLRGNHLKVDYRSVPSVVFTVPPLASVGLQEYQAKDSGLSFDVNYHETSDWYSSRRINEKYSGFKVLIEKQTGRILGAHLLGSHADETINLFAMAIRFDLTSSKLKDAFYAYPTVGSNIPHMIS